MLAGDALPVRHTAQTEKGIYSYPWPDRHVCTRASPPHQVCWRLGAEFTAVRTLVRGSKD